MANLPGSERKEVASEIQSFWSKPAIRKTTSNVLKSEWRTLVNRCDSQLDSAESLILSNLPDSDLKTFVTANPDRLRRALLLTIKKRLEVF